MLKNLNPTEQLSAQGYLADQIVTGEAVVLELPAATAFSRIVSGGIDLLFYALLAAGALLVFREINLPLNEGLLRSGLIIAIAFFVWILPATITALTRGSSLGKLILRVRTVRLDGGTISTRQAFIRGLVAILEVWMTVGVMAVGVMITSKRAQRLGDMLAGTYVVRWPKRGFKRPALVFPPQLAPWAQTAQTRPIPTGLHLNIVNHLAHAKKFTADARMSQAKTLAAAAEAYVSPPVPWGTPPEDFLAALVFLRFEIESANNERDDQNQQRIMGRVQTLKF